MAFDDLVGFGGEGFEVAGAVVRFRREELFVLVVDGLHVIEVGGVELVFGDGFELGEACGELFVEAGGDGNAGGGGDLFEFVADEGMVVDFGDGEVFDVLRLGVEFGVLAGGDLVGSALRDLADEGGVDGRGCGEWGERRGARGRRRWRRWRDGVGS